MGVYIKGMEMPKSCYVCPFCDYVSARCDAVKGNPYTPESRYEKRADFCPLIPVPPHGRLIEADALEEHKFVCIPKVIINGKYAGSAYRLGWNSAIEAIVENAETIIGGE